MSLSRLWLNAKHLESILAVVFVDASILASDQKFWFQFQIGIQSSESLNEFLSLSLSHFLLSGRINLLFDSTFCISLSIFTFSSDFVNLRSKLYLCDVIVFLRLFFISNTTFWESDYIMTRSKYALCAVLCASYLSHVQHVWHE